jgi:translation elongation factor EF-G
VDYPLSQLITNEPGPSQRWFAQEAAGRVPSGTNVQAEVTDEGLLIRGISELDLEVASHAIVQQYRGAKVHKPQVRYIEGPPLQEPYYQIVITTPEESLGNVVGDLTSRRATIALIQDAQSGKRLSAEIPVGECWGYSTQLRSLTRGHGTYEVAFIGYRPCWGSDGGEPVDVA